MILRPFISKKIFKLKISFVSIKKAKDPKLNGNNIKKRYKHKFMIDY